ATMARLSSIARILFILKILLVFVVRRGKMAPASRKFRLRARPLFGAIFSMSFYLKKKKNDA
ncbi:MAG: hypothetical protein IJ466_12325, partial [Clostridia bacterium]|nr:hypothetical protein [Clostridia bacterium]